MLEGSVDEGRESSLVIVRRRGECGLSVRARKGKGKGWFHSVAAELGM
jgi:hypothetical protein